MQSLALPVVIAAGLWLLGVGVLMVARPGYCLDLLGRMSNNLKASNWRLNLTEQGLRLLAGSALIVRAPVSKLPLLFEVLGWILVVSSAIILLVPITWHGAYGKWWAERLTPRAIRLLSPPPAILGAVLIYAAA